MQVNSRLSGASTLLQAYPSTGVGPDFQKQ